MVPPKPPSVVLQMKLDLLSAAKSGETDRVRELLRAGAPVDARDATDATPLHEAAWFGHTDTARVLLRAGAVADASDKIGRTPLHWAALRGRTEVALALLRAGAAADASDRDGDTPLHRAACNGHTDIVLALLRAGAAAGSSTKNGERPLHEAAEWGRTDIALALLRAGAAVDASNNAGETPLHKAARQGETATALALVEAGASLEARSIGGFAPLELAAAGGHPDTAAALRQVSATPSQAAAASLGQSSASPVTDSIAVDARYWSFDFESLKERQLIGSGSFGKVSGLRAREGAAADGGLGQSRMPLPAAPDRSASACSLPCSALLCAAAVQVYRAQHNETVYAVKVLTGMDDLATAAAALSLSDSLLHKFEQVCEQAAGQLACRRVHLGLIRGQGKQGSC